MDGLLSTGLMPSMLFRSYGVVKVVGVGWQKGIWHGDILLQGVIPSSLKIQRLPKK